MADYSLDDVEPVRNSETVFHKIVLAQCITNEDMVRFDTKTPGLLINSPPGQRAVRPLALQLDVFSPTT
jgi:hypothetical protein